MDRMIQRTVKSKTLKVFLIAIVLVFSYEVSKPKAFVPLAWAGAVLAGMAAETLVTAGVKATSKAILKKKADDYAAQALKDGKFDFMGTNPYRNKDGSLTLSPSANDRAKMAGLISGGLIGLMTENGMSEACLPAHDTTKYVPIVSDPQLTSGDFGKYFFIQQESLTSIGIYSVYTGLRITELGNHPYWTYLRMVSVTSDGLYTVSTDWTETLNGPKIKGNSLTVSRNQAVPSEYFNSLNVAESNGSTLHMCDGLIFPDTVKNIYPAPMDMSSTYQMPNHDQLKDKPITIPNVMPPSTTEGPITWTEVETYYTNNSGDFSSVMNDYVDSVIVNGDMATVITGDQINNYYTDINQAEKVEDFNPELETGLEPVPDTQPPAVIEPVAPINRGMLQVMTESYEFLADGIDNSIQSMKSVTDGATGLINYLDGAFRWLPAEWRAMFGAAFVLGVFAHFFRR